MNLSIKIYQTNLMINYAEKIVPKNFTRKTGQIIKLLSIHSNGLSLEEIHKFFYNKLYCASLTRRESLRMSVEKIIQRSRKKFQNYNLTIKYSKTTKRYYLDMIKDI